MATGGEDFSGLISVASQVNYFIVAGGILGLTGIIAKLFIKNDQGTIKFLGMEIPLNHLWFAMVLLSLAHVFYSWSLLVEITRILECDDRQLSQAAWEKLTDSADERRVLYDLAERVPVPGYGPIPFPIHLSDVSQMSSRDPLMFLHIFLILSVVLATVRWFRTRSRFLRVWTTIFAIFLLFVNWAAGSQWALLASDLARHGRGEAQRMTDLRETVVDYSGAKCRR